MNNKSMELEWFQIALKTYFWVGIICGVVSCTGIACLLGSKYYYDQTVLRHIEMERDYRSYRDHFFESKENLRKVEAVWREVYRIKEKINASNTKGL